MTHWSYLCWLSRIHVLIFILISSCFNSAGEDRFYQVIVMLLVEALYLLEALHRKVTAEEIIAKLPALEISFCFSVLVFLHI